MEPIKPARPIWLPDTQGFLAVAILLLVGGIVWILLTETPKFDDKAAGAFMTLLGVLTACLKDVYNFFFGSSKGSEKKDDVISTIATNPTPTAPPTTTDDVAKASLSPEELVFYETLGTEEVKKKFLGMSAAERTAAIGRGAV